MAVEALTTIGALVADRTRATVLVALMDGRARTAGELARHAQVAPSTISEHLARLVEAGMIETAAQGKHRYFRIANDDVGLMLETVGGIELTSKGPAARWREHRKNCGTRVVATTTWPASWRYVSTTV